MILNMKNIIWLKTLYDTLSSLNAHRVLLMDYIEGKVQDCSISIVNAL